MSQHLRLLIAVLLSGALLLGACTDADDGADDPATDTAEAPAAPDGEAAEPTEPPTLQPSTSAPDDDVVVVGDSDPAAGAVAASEALFDDAPLVVLAPAGPAGGQLQAASAAVHLGTPLLLVADAPAAGGGTAAGTTDEDATDTGDDEADDATSTPEDAGADPEAADDAGTAPAPTPAVDLDAELARLGTTTVLAFGDAAETAGLPDDLTVVRAPEDTDELAELIGADAPAAVAEAEIPAALADLRPGEGAVLVLADPHAEPEGADDPGAPGEDDAEDGGADGEDGDGEEPIADPASSGATAPTPSPDDAADQDTGTADEDAALPDHEPAAPLDDLRLLLDRSEPAVAALATGLAAGGEALLLDDPDPRADPSAIAELADGPPEQVLAVGGGFGDADLVRDRLAVAATGVELPGGGQVLFPHRRLVALYGHPGSTVLGALGEQPLDGAVARAREVAATYEPHSDMPVIPTFEIITTIASATAQEDQSYSLLSDVEHIRPWVDRAREEGIYVVLDLQPGRTDFLTQAQHYEELLLEPHVGLALDPEWRLEAHQVHLRQIGSVDADEVNTVVEWLADLTREHALPQKLLILHQFRHDMLPERERIDFTRDELAVLIHMDGNGPPSVKMDTWNALTAVEPEGAWWGWKNFYDEDSPTMTPEQTVAVEPPPPLFISYQ